MIKVQLLRRHVPCIKSVRYATQSRRTRLLSHSIRAKRMKLKIRTILSSALLFVSLFALDAAVWAQATPLTNTFVFAKWVEMFGGRHHQVSAAMQMIGSGVFCTLTGEKHAGNRRCQS